MKDAHRIVPADEYVEVIAENVDNQKMTDKEFREFIRNTLSIIQYNGV